jgi:hypothetical protein
MLVPSLDDQFSKDSTFKRSIYITMSAFCAATESAALDSGVINTLLGCDITGGAGFCFPHLID